MIYKVLLTAILLGCSTAPGQEAETLPLLTNAVAPQNFEEMWAGFDPRAESLEIETIKEWEEDGVVLGKKRGQVQLLLSRPAWQPQCSLKPQFLRGTCDPFRTSIGCSSDTTIANRFKL
jgi:hypothetical protein